MLGPSGVTHYQEMKNMKTVRMIEGFRPSKEVEEEIKVLRQVSKDNKIPFFNRQKGESVMQTPYDIGREYNQLKIQLYRQEQELITKIVIGLLHLDTCFTLTYDRAEPVIIVDLEDAEARDILLLTDLMTETYGEAVEKEE